MNVGVGVGVGVGVKGYDENSDNSDTGPGRVVVSASDCGSQVLGFESHQSHFCLCFFFFFIHDLFLPGAGSAMGHNRNQAGTTRPSFIHFTDASLRVLL